MAYDKKTRRINVEKDRLMEMFKDLAPAQMALALPLIERASWMRIECEDLEKDIQQNGWTEPFQQSSKLEPYDRARPQGQTYQTLNAGYQKIIRQLERMLPSGTTAVDDGFDAFLNSDD